MPVKKWKWKRPASIRTSKSPTLEINIPGGPRVVVDLTAKAVYVEMRHGRVQEGSITETLEIDKGILVDKGPSPDGHWTKGIEILY